MWWILLIILGAIVLVPIVKSFIRSSTPEGYAREIARTQLHAFRIQKKLNPNLPREEVYGRVLLTRPSYDEDRVEKVLNEARGGQDNKKINFRNVVYGLIVVDFLSRLGGKAALPSSLFHQVASEEIPDDI